MAVSARRAAAGGIGVGVLAGEGIQQSAERNITTQRTSDLAAVGVSTTGVGLAALDAAGVVRVPGAPAFAGVGVGTAGWYAGRRAGVAPRLTASVPNEINLAGPFVSLLVFGAVASGVSAIARATR